MATDPSAQPTAISLGDSHVKHAHTVEGGLAAKTGDWTLSVGLLTGEIIHSQGFLTELSRITAPRYLNINDSHHAIAPHSC